MDVNHLIYSLDLIGTLVFAISGTMAASDKRLDFFGALFTGFVTAVGGGTTRDILLDSHPVVWIGDINYLYTIALGVFITFLFRKHVLKLRKTLFLFDTIGIGLFTIIGTSKVLAMGLSPLVAVIMGMVSSVVGGVIRDILVNEIPLIFRREIYATACIIGGTTFYLLSQTALSRNINIAITISIVIAIRLIAIRFKLQLPRAKS